MFLNLLYRQVPFTNVSNVGRMAHRQIVLHTPGLEVTFSNVSNVGLMAHRQIVLHTPGLEVTFSNVSNVVLWHTDK